MCTAQYSAIFKKITQERPCCTGQTDRGNVPSITHDQLSDNERQDCLDSDQLSGNSLREFLLKPIVKMIDSNCTPGVRHSALGAILISLNLTKITLCIFALMSQTFSPFPTKDPQNCSMVNIFFLKGNYQRYRVLLFNGRLDVNNDRVGELITA